jgi:hypothetical protein
MLRNRTGSLVVLAMLVALVGCPPKPAPPAPVTIVAMVTPICDPTNGCGVQQLAQPGQILEWRAMYPVPANYWIVFAAGGNPCEGAPASLPGTTSSPAHCTVAATQTSGQYIKYSYVIVDQDPTKSPPVIQFSTTPCGGCSYSVGPGSGGSTTSTAAAIPSSLAPATVAPKKTAFDNPGEIDLSCVSGGAITVQPTAKTAETGVFWTLSGSAFDWQVKISDASLCKEGQTITSSGPPICTFNSGASGTYQYDVTSTSTVCTPSGPSTGNTITVSSTAPKIKKKP